MRVTPPFFFYGMLRHVPLRREVLGTDAGAVPAVLPGHAAHRVAGGEPLAMLVPDPAAEAAGVIVADPGGAAAGRLAAYAGSLGYAPRAVEVRGPAGLQPALAFLPERSRRPGPPWDQAEWDRTWGAIVTEAAAEVLRLAERFPPGAAARRHGQILARAASRLRARVAAPATLRRRALPGDVEVRAWTQAYARFFAVEELRLRFRRFGGAMSPVVDRAVFVSGDAATVLPYDPVRDRVLLIEQFRPGPFARGDAEPWQLEPVAGRIDPGETPEEAARREAREEAGVELGRLIPVAAYYPSPAGKVEYLYSFLGLADLPDALAGRVHGSAEEDEDIRVHLVGFDRLMALVDSGEAQNAPLILSALMLARHRAALRGRA
jgi:nudix-type nucleoside diphosphatase (YffH/AdpP family)